MGKHTSPQFTPVRFVARPFACTRPLLTFVECRLRSWCLQLRKSHHRPLLLGGSCSSSNQLPPLARSIGHQTRLLNTHQYSAILGRLVTSLRDFSALRCEPLLLAFQNSVSRSSILGAALLSPGVVLTRILGICSSCAFGGNQLHGRLEPRNLLSGPLLLSHQSKERTGMMSPRTVEPPNPHDCNQSRVVTVSNDRFASGGLPPRPGESTSSRNINGGLRIIIGQE